MTDKTRCMGCLTPIDPEFDVCEECALPADLRTEIERERIAWGTGNDRHHGDYLTAHGEDGRDYGGAFDGFQVTSDADPGL